jgi:hypothetical protein
MRHQVAPLDAGLKSRASKVQAPAFGPRFDRLDRYVRILEDFYSRSDKGEVYRENFAF